MRNRDDDFRTDPALFAWLNRLYHFTVDACASRANALLPHYWTKETDASRQDWSGEVVFCNPPFRVCWGLVRKAPSARTAVFILPIPCLPKLASAYGHFSFFAIPAKRMRFRAPDGKAVTPCHYGGTMLVVWGSCEYSPFEADGWKVFARLPNS
jgi:hypothetical protein